MAKLWFSLAVPTVKLNINRKHHMMRSQGESDYKQGLPYENKNTTGAKKHKKIGIND